MNNIFTIDFLIKCSECYYNMGDYYKANANECAIIENELNVKIFDSYPIEITDDIYDRIYDLAKNKFAWHQFFGMIGADVGNYGDEIEFKNPAGSMTELKEGDWDKWNNHKDYVISEKLDGLSVVLFYNNGCLVKAASRGDGYKGKDITRHILHITNIPKTIDYKDECEVRGELICPRKDIQSMIDDLKEETGKEYKNGRNTISGFLNSKNTLLSVAKYAKFMAFDTTIPFKNEYDKFILMRKYGFESPVHTFNNHEITEEYLIKYVKMIKEQSDFECDGIIITVNDTNDPNYQGFETGTINPKKSRKFKIGATNNSAETTIKNIIWNVSKDGKLIPTIEIEPINVVGVTIQNVTGHNYKNVIDSGLGIGARILVIRSGDVIPYIKKIIEPVFDNYNIPNVKTFINGVDIELDDKFTINEYTKQMAVNKLVFFCKSMEIDNVGEGICKQLVDDWLTCHDCNMDAFDLIKLSKTYLYNLIGENGIKIYESIKSKLYDGEVDEVDLIASLGTFGENMGKRILQLVYDKYGTLNVTEAQLKMLSGFGDTRIKQYINYLFIYNTTKESLKLLNIKFKTYNNDKVSDKFAKYIVCFTGVRDANLSKYIRDNGGIASDSWNKNVNLLICKDPNSNSGKIKKALEKGIKVITIEEAREIFK